MIDAMSDGSNPAAGDSPELSAVYREREHLVASLAGRYESVMTAAPDVPGWAIVYVETWAGQLSWHIHPDNVPLFRGVVTWVDEWTWDGHTTEKKYARLRSLTLHGPGPDVDDLSAKLTAAQTP